MLSKMSLCRFIFLDSFFSIVFTFIFKNLWFIKFIEIFCDWIFFGFFLFCWRFAALMIGMGVALSPLIELPVVAQDSRDTLVRQIVEAQQLPTAWSESLAKSAEANTQMAKGLLDQIAKQSGGTLPPTFQAAFDRFVSKISSGVTVEEMVDEWSRLYGAQLSINELREILSFYQSPAGIKSAKAARGALPEFQNWRNQKLEKRAADAFKEFLADIESAR